MNLQLNSLKALKKKLGRRADLNERKLLNPMREWTTGLGVTITAFVIAAAYLGYDFYAYLNSDRGNTTDEVPLVEYRQRDVEKILKIYEERAVVFDRLRHDKSNYQAPVTTLADDEEEQYSNESPQPIDAPLPSAE